MRRALYALIATTAVALSATASLAPAPGGNRSATGDYIRSNGSHMVINAIKHKDGSTSGWMQYESPGGQVIIVQVDDVVFIGNSAYIHGIVQSDNYGVTTGFHSYHRVVDNGERAGSDPDRASSFRNSPTPLGDPIGALASTFPISDGNIQVRSE